MCDLLNLEDSRGALVGMIPLFLLALLTGMTSFVFHLQKGGEAWALEDPSYRDFCFPIYKIG